MKKVIAGCTFALGVLFAGDSLAGAGDCDNVWMKECKGKGPSCVKKAVANCVKKFNASVPVAKRLPVCSSEACLAGCDKYGLSQKPPLPSKIKKGIAKCIIAGGADKV